MGKLLNSYYKLLCVWYLIQAYWAQLVPVRLPRVNTFYRIIITDFG